MLIKHRSCLMTLVPSRHRFFLVMEKFVVKHILSVYFNQIITGSSQSFCFSIVSLNMQRQKPVWVLQVMFKSVTYRGSFNPWSDAGWNCSLSHCVLCLMASRRSPAVVLLTTNSPPPSCCGSRQPRPAPAPWTWAAVLRDRYGVELNVKPLLSLLLTSMNSICLIFSQMEKDETVGESSPHIANIGRLVEVRITADILLL